MFTQRREGAFRADGRHVGLSLLLSRNSERTAKEIFSGRFSPDLLELLSFPINALINVFAVIR
jgi:hypothetical protein